MTATVDEEATGKPGPAPPEDLLTLAELAQVADSSDQFSRATMDKLGALVRSLPRFAQQLAYLEALAQDAGLPPGQDDRLHAGWLCNEDFDALRAASEWRHPAEVLDPEGSLGINYPELMSIATARAERADAPAALLAIRDKLAAAHRAEQQQNNSAEAFVDTLLAAAPEDSEILLRRVERAYRSHRRRQEHDHSAPDEATGAEASA